MFMGDNAEFTFLMIFFKMGIFVIKIVMANIVELRNVWPAILDVLVGCEYVFLELYLD